MANTKPKAPKFNIRGIARYPKTDRPYRWDDDQEKSVPDPEGEYQIDVVVSGDRGAAVQKDVLAFAKEVLGKAPKKQPFKDEKDKESDEPTGNVIITAKQYGKDRDGEVKRIPHFDSQGNPLGADFRLTSGSEVIIKVRPSTYKAQGGGVKLYLDGIQVVKYREPQRQAMFDAVEDGDFVSNNDTASGNYADEPEVDDGTDSNEEGSTDF